MQAIGQAPKRALEFGIYRDGDNNLDASQAATLDQAVAVSKANSAVEFTIEDTSAQNSPALRTRRYAVSDGVIHDVADRAPDNMASPHNLAEFVRRTLDRAQASGAQQTWIELSDHGAGDGGGLAADSRHSIMSIDSMADAIAQGVAAHARAHPEDASRKIDGVLANQCLMSSLAFGDELSHAGVHFLAASPETMLSPGTPTTVADAVARHVDDSQKMARSVVDTVMDARYTSFAGPYAPAAAFSVLDLAPTKWAELENDVRALNDRIGAATQREAPAIREDARAIAGMVRFPEATSDMPWKADRPALTLYDTLAQDGRLNVGLREAAREAAKAVAATVLAHRESDDFAPFHGADYSDAIGPTVHFPADAAQFDPWSPNVSETHNRFFASTDGDRLHRIAS